MPNLIRVMTKARKHLGKDYPPSATDYQVEFAGKTGITVYRDDANGTPIKGTSFSVGDTAEYNSWNLTYTGIITKITEKAVTIVAYKGSRNETVHKLDLNKFCWRNHKFDAARVAAENAETSMYI